MKILIIEDEYNLADAIAASLRKEKYKTTIFSDGEDGLYEAQTTPYDLIILDVMLPGKDGFEILRSLKENEVPAKVIMLTAKSTIEDKMNGFNNGADDYLTKPFHMDELIARVNLQLRNTGREHSVIEFGDLELDIKNMILKNKENGMTVNVVGKEFELIETLMSHPDQISQKDALFEKIWGYDTESEINTLEAYTSFLRKKLRLLKSKVGIKTTRGVGYRLEVNEKTQD